MAEYHQNKQPEPNPDLKPLDKLIGTWKQSGGVEGYVTYEWMEGSFFLVQRVDLESGGYPIKGMEIIEAGILLKSEGRCVFSIRIRKL